METVLPGGFNEDAQSGHWPDRDHEIARTDIGGGVSDSVFIIRACKTQAPWPEPRGLAVDGEIERTVDDHHHFFVHVMVRRVRFLARPEFCLVGLDPKARVREAVKDGVRYVLPARPRRKVLKSICHGLERRQVCGLGATGCHGGQRGQQKREVVSSCSVHLFLF